MEIYVLRVKPQTEKSTAKMINQLGYSALCPIKEMHIRSGGRWIKRQELVFTQYIFVECDLDDKVWHEINSIDGVIDFLGRGNPNALTPHEAAYIKWLNNNGKPIEASGIFVTGNGDKMVLSGLLRNYDSDMIDLDLRRRRARLSVSFCGVHYNITLPVVAV